MEVEMDLVMLHSVVCIVLLWVWETPEFDVSEEMGFVGSEFELWAIGWYRGPTERREIRLRMRTLTGEK